MPSDLTTNEGTSSDDFYDGTPRFDDSFSHKSKFSDKSKASVSSRLSRAGTIGLEKAINVLDTLGSSMTNLNVDSGFFSGAATRGCRISILSFEVANTIVKGFCLMESLSTNSIKHLKQEVLQLEAVQDLVSKDMDELLCIVSADKREELKVFSDGVTRFGNLTIDPQWHNLDRYFCKLHSLNLSATELNSQRQSKDEVELMMQQLMTLVQFTVELYQELHVYDRFQQDYQRKLEEDDNLGATRSGDSLSILRAEIKGQRKQIRDLKKKSLWWKNLEEVMVKLVEIVRFLHFEINVAFGSADARKPLIGTMSNHQKRLGYAGLALHYANIVLQIDSLVAGSISMSANTRGALYQSLPPNIKSALRSKLPSFRVAEEELTVADIKNEIEKTLHWLVPIATNTAKAHHCFGSVGEWANTGSELNIMTVKADIIRIETIHHADKDKVENYIIELLLWLHLLAIKSKGGSDASEMGYTIKHPIGTALQLQKTNQQSKHALPPLLTTDEQNKLHKQIYTSGNVKSLDFDTRLGDNSRLITSNSYSSTNRGKELSFNRISSKLPVIDFDID